MDKAPIIFRSDVAVLEKKRWSRLPSAGFVNPGVLTVDLPLKLVVVDWTFVQVDSYDSPQETASLQVRTFHKARRDWSHVTTNVQVEVKSRGVLHDGVIFVCAKKPASIVKYDPLSCEITRIPPPPGGIPLAPCHLTVLNGDLALVPRGGDDPSSSSSSKDCSLYLRHQKTGVWRKHIIPAPPSDPDRDTIFRMVESAVGYNPYGGFVPIDLG